MQRKHMPYISTISHAYIMNLSAVSGVLFSTKKLLKQQCFSQGIRGFFLWLFLSFSLFSPLPFRFFGASKNEDSGSSAENLILFFFCLIIP